MAEKLIEINKNDDFDILFVIQNDNEKYLYYLNKIKKIVGKVYVFRANGKRSSLLFWEIIKFKLKNELLNNIQKYYKFYLASIDSPLFQLILTKRKKESLIYTFDDGLANLYKKSIYYKGNPQNFQKKIAYKILGINESIASIKKNAITHYTIYNYDNILKKTNIISLFENKNNLNEFSQILKIFIGQPYREIDENLTNDFVKKIIDKTQADLYFPHPREVDFSWVDKEVITSNLIFEEFVLELLKINPEMKIQIFSINSSVLFNLSNVNNIEIFFWQNDILKEKYAQLYEIMKKFKFNTF